MEVFFSSGVLFTAGLAGLLLFLILLITKDSIRPKGFPIGPPMLPIVGSIPYMEAQPSFELFKKWKKKYGPVVGFSMLKTRMVAVSDPVILRQCLAQTAVSGRPSMGTIRSRHLKVSNHVTENVGVLFSWGKMWEEQRRFLLRNLRDMGLGKSSLEPIIAEEVEEIIDIFETSKGAPVALKNLFQRSIINVLWGLIIGKRFPRNDPKATEIFETFETLLDSSILTNPLLHLPGAIRFFSYFPNLLAPMKVMMDVYYYFLDEVKKFEKIPPEERNDSIVSLYLQEMENEKTNTNTTFKIYCLAIDIVELFFAGSETTSTGLINTLRQVAMDQKLQKRIHDELDSQFERDQMPSCNDIAKLPVCQSVIHESLRFYTVLALGVTRNTLEDTVIGGYNVPKNTTVFENLHGALHDEKYWKYPDTYDVRNFITDDGKLIKNDSFIPFGAGRRVCLGESLARQQLFLFFTSIMQKFHLKIVSDEPNNSKNKLLSRPPFVSVSATPRE